MFEGGRNDIEKAIELLKTINQNMKVDHMMKDMWDGATEEETREYIEDFGLINLAIEALEKQSPKSPKAIMQSDKYKFGDCPSCGKVIDMYDKHCKDCGQRLDWSVEE